MAKKLQVLLNDEAWSLVEGLLKEANENFDGGSISYSDLLNEIVLSARVDIRSLQLKHTDWRRSLKAIASKSEADLELTIKTLTELKAKSGKRKSSSSSEEQQV